jgi:hypothetical protein
MDGPEGKGGHVRDLTMNTALDVARFMVLDLTLAGVSAWQWWLAVSPSDYKDGLLYTDWKRPGDAESIYASSLFWTFGHFSRFLRPGMRRIELAGDGHDIRRLMGATFKDDKSHRVVAVYLNLGTEDCQVVADIAGERPWRPRELALHVTSDRPGDELRACPTVAPGAAVTIPARSAVTMVMS